MRFLNICHLHITYIVFCQGFSTINDRKGGFGRRSESSLFVRFCVYLIADSVVFQLPYFHFEVDINVKGFEEGHLHVDVTQ